MNKQYSPEATKTMAAAAAFCKTNSLVFLPPMFKAPTKEQKAA